MVTNSVVPIAKPPIASATIAGQKCDDRVLVSTDSEVSVVPLLVIVTIVQPDAGPGLFLTIRPR
jgi:hypothetical protein